MIFFKKILEIKSKAGILHFTRWAIFDSKYLRLYIHKINESDKDHLHSHPWNFVSVILKGSYEEELLDWKGWPTKQKPPTTLNLKKFLTITFMNRFKFHKIKRIVNGPVYSLVLTLGDHKDWYYMVDDCMVESNIYRDSNFIRKRI